MRALLSRFGVGNVLDRFGQLLSDPGHLLLAFKLAKQHHPDLKQGDKEAEARFREIQAAYDVLKSAEERRSALSG